MVSFKVLILIILVIWIILLYNEYSPAIDVVKSGNKYTILLWYNKKYYNEGVKRVYIKLFEI